MGTCNFYSKNTDIIYQINHLDDFEYDDLIMGLQYDFQSIGYHITDEYTNDRNYCGRIFAEYSHELNIPISYNGINDEMIIYLNIRPMVRSGYYSGCNFDMEYSIDFFETNGNSYDIDDIDDYLIYEIRSFFENHFPDHHIWDDIDKIKLIPSGWIDFIDQWMGNEFNEFISNANKIINDRFNLLKNQIETIFAQYSDNQLKHIGTFSNGEGLYEKWDANDG